MHGAGYRPIGRRWRNQVPGPPQPPRPNLILRSWQHAVDEHSMGSIGQSVPGILDIPVEIEFQRPRSWAVQYRVPFLWVDDPDGLFPPANRLQVQC